MALSERDLRAIELVEKYHQKNLKENLEEYHKFLDILISLHETLADENVKIQQWQKLSEHLLLKFYLHGNTIFHIYSGTELKSNYIDDKHVSIKILDIPSAKVLQRAQLEAFLMYHHIYVNPKTEDEKQLRYYAWIYSSLLERQEFPTKTEIGKDVIAKDLNTIESIRGIMLNLASFKELNEKQQKALIKTGSKKLFKHWATIMEETGFPKNHGFSTLYSIMSSHAHSEGLGIIQLSDTNIFNSEENEIAYLDVHISKLLVCMMISTIKDLYKSIGVHYNNLPEVLRYDIELYATLGASL